MKKHSRAAANRAHRKPGLYLFIATVCVCLFAFFFWKGRGASEAEAGNRPNQQNATAHSGPADDAVVRTLVREEETYLALAPKMKALSESIMDLRLPGPRANSVFAPNVVLSDLGPVPEVTLEGTDLIEPQPWPVSSETKEAADVNLWRPLLDAVSYFENEIGRAHV